MRVLFLVPDLFRNRAQQRAFEEIDKRPRIPVAAKRRLLSLLLSPPRLGGARRGGAWPPIGTHVAWGGTLNIMRHCTVARLAGFDAWMATPSGDDTYGAKAITGMRYLPFADRKPGDLLVVPDFVSWMVDGLAGPIVVYEQAPQHIHTDFDHRRSDVLLWTDSPMMLELCKRAFPDKDIPITPNVVDDKMFPFVPQAEREPGTLFAFPRKEPAFIDATERAYRAAGGRYWRFERIDGLSIHELAFQFRRPQAFLASAVMEGCALPPQECMAAGVVVVGRNARGANFAMEHKKTAMVAETPEEAAQCLVELERTELRDAIAQAGYQFIQRYFWEREPLAFWRALRRTFPA